MKLSALIRLPRRGFSRVAQGVAAAKRFMVHRAQRLQRLRWKRLVAGAVVAVAVVTTSWWLIRAQEIKVEPVPAVEEQNPQLAGGAEVSLPDLDGAATVSTTGQAEPPAAVSEPDATEENVLGVMEAPLNGPVLAAFSFRYEPTYGDYRLHPGLDLGAAEGTSVKAVWPGRVSSIAYTPEEGYRITMEHAQGYQTIYSHLGRVIVLDGAEVGQGQEIGRVGAAGVAEADRGPHLHLEVRQHGTAVNPVDFLPAIWETGS